MRDAIRAAGLPLDCWPHGLQKTLGNRLADKGGLYPRLLSADTAPIARNWTIKRRAQLPKPRSRVSRIILKSELIQDTETVSAPGRRTSARWPRVPKREARGRAYFLGPVSFCWASAISAKSYPVETCNRPSRRNGQSLHRCRLPSSPPPRSGGRLRSEGMLQCRSSVSTPNCGQGVLNILYT
jgi:hypothetical protein